MSLPAKTPQPRGAQDISLRDELKAALAARRELGPESEDALIDNFIQQLERAVEARLGTHARDLAEIQKKKQGMRIATLAISLGLAIPLTAIAAGIGGFPGLIVVWGVILVINLIDFNR